MAASCLMETENVYAIAGLQYLEERLTITNAGNVVSKK